MTCLDESVVTCLFADSRKIEFGLGRGVRSFFFAISSKTGPGFAHFLALLAQNYYHGYKESGA
jgi:hypothetical protein